MIIANQPAPAPTNDPPRAVDPRRALPSSVFIRYLGGGPVLVRGPLTGRGYAFPAAGAVQAVDERDAAALLRTRLFRPA